MSPATWHRKLKTLLSRFDPERSLVRKGDVHGLAHSSMPLAELLLRRDDSGDRQTAIAIIEQVLAAQHRKPGPDYGRFPMLVPEGWRDLNGTLFLVSSAVAIVEEHAQLLPEGLVRQIEDALWVAATAVERRWQEEVFDVHRDYAAYSNIFVLYIQSLLLLGRHFDDSRLVRAGQGQWRRWFNHVSAYGIDEFVSPNYNQIILTALKRMESCAASADVQREMAMVVEHLLGLQYALHHPVLGLPISGVSRDYRLFADPGKGGLPAIADGEVDEKTPAAALQEYRNRQYPFRAAGRAGITPFRFTSWQTQHAGVGSMTGGHYFPQQLHLMIAVGDSATERAVAFTNADASNVVNGYVAQNENRALCLFARTTTSYFHTQTRQRIDALPAARTRPPSMGFVGPWTTVSADESGVVIEAYAHRLHIRPFFIEDGRLHRTVWHEGVMRMRSCDVRVLRADDAWTFAGYLVELHWADETEGVCLAEISATTSDRQLAIRESGGLSINLAQLPSGEFIETYDRDWRLLPLFQSPAHELWPGDLALRASEEPRR